MTATTREHRPPPGNAGNAEPQLGKSGRDRAELGLGAPRQEPTIPPGYKQTEVGIIPEDWEVKRLGELVTFLDGQRRPVKDADRAKMRGTIPYYGASGVVDYVNSYLFDEKLVLLGEDGENIISRSTKLAFLVSGKCWVNNHAHVLRPNSLVAINYLAEALEAINYEIYNSGTAQPKLNKKACYEIPLSLPTRPEQEVIAGALSDTDAWIESLEKLIEKKRVIKQGAMQALLTPPGQPGHQRLPGFKGEWEVKRLGEIGSFLKGAGVRKDDANSGPLPCIRYGEIYTHHKDHINRFYSWISSAVASTAVRLRQGDILFAGSGETKAEIGKCVAYLKAGEAYAGGDIVIMRGHEQCPEFLGYYLNVPEINRQKASRGQGDAIVHITGSALASIGCSLPRFSEQSAIAAVLSDMDAEIEAVEAKLAKARQIKQGMMQELLTGRVRLV